MDYIKNSLFRYDVKKAPFRYVLRTIGYIILSLPASGMFMLIIWALLKKIGAVWLFWIIAAAVLALLIYWLVKAAQKYMDKTFRIFGTVTPHRFQLLEKEYAKSEPEFHSFYMFETHIYAPREMVLVPYDKICQVRSEYHSSSLFKLLIRDYSGVTLVLVCSDNKRYEIAVRDMEEYKIHYEAFLRSINQRREHYFEVIKQEFKTIKQEDK